MERSPLSGCPQRRVLSLMISGREPVAVAVVLLAIAVANQPAAQCPSIRNSWASICNRFSFITPMEHAHEKTNHCSSRLRCDQASQIK